MDLANQLVQGLKHVCDMALASRLLASVVALASMFLAYQTSKKAPMNMPFTGDRQFGSSLDEVPHWRKKYLLTSALERQGFLLQI